MGLDSVELVLATEEEFGISIDDADAARLTTPGELADYVALRLGTPAGQQYPWSRDYLLRRIITLTSRQLGIPIAKIHPDSRFVQDLGMD